MRPIRFAFFGFLLLLVLSSKWNPGASAQEKNDRTKAKLAAIEKELANTRKQIEDLRRQEQALLKEKKRITDRDERPTDLTPPATAGQIEAELKALQGTWLLVGCERQGRRLSRKEFTNELAGWGDKLRLRIEGTKLVLGDEKAQGQIAFRRDGPPRSLTWQLRPTQVPKAFDISLRGGGLFTRRTWTYQGVYRRKGKRLEVGLFAKSNEKWKDFNTKPGSTRRILIYERSDPTK